MSFDPSFFAELRGAESNHFWFNVRRKWILDAVSGFASPPAKILEIGCGTGNVSGFLSNHGYNVVGCEYYMEALEMAWPGFDKVQGSANDLPFADNSFNAVCLLDVIEHFDNETHLVQEARRVLKPDGFIIITVPAREELWSYIDEISFHKRRYSIKSIFTTLKKSDFNPVSVDYMFMLLYLPMKILRRKKGKTGDLLKISPAINLIAQLIFDFERIVSQIIKLPIGTSIIAVAKK